MAVDHTAACDAILATLKTPWDAGTVAVAGYVPHLVYEDLEPDLKPHPRDGTLAWARVVIRHADAGQATLTNADRTARFRRFGLVWVQIFVPAIQGGAGAGMALALAKLAQKAYEGKRASGGAVVFTKAAIFERPHDGAWRRCDVKSDFYWDEIH